MRAGWSPDGEPPRFPLVLGTDGSRTIAAIGSGVRRFAVGDRVYAFSFANPKGGFYAEFVAVTKRECRPPARGAHRAASGSDSRNRPHGASRD